MVQRYVDEGATLEKGAPVARLDDREYRLQVERAAAAKAVAEARHRLVLRGSRAQEVDQALSALEAAESDLRLQRLSTSGSRGSLRGRRLARGEGPRRDTARRCRGDA